MKKIFMFLIIAIFLVLFSGLASACSYDSCYEDYKFVITKKDYFNKYERTIKTYYSEPYEIKTIYYEYKPYEEYKQKVYYDDYYCRYYEYYNRPSYYYKYYPNMKTIEIHECYHYPPAGKLFYIKCP